MSTNAHLTHANTISSGCGLVNNPAKHAKNHLPDIRKKKKRKKQKKTSTKEYHLLYLRRRKIIESKIWKILRRITNAIRFAPCRGLGYTNTQSGVPPFVRVCSATFGAGVNASHCPITRPKRRIAGTLCASFARELKYYSIKHISTNQ